MPAEIEISPEQLLDLSLRGLNHKEQAVVLDCSPATVSKKIAQLQKEQGVLIQYRALQSLQLTALQVQILEHITPHKIASASLRDLVAAFKILKDKELAIEGKPSEIKGLVGYLVEMEKREIAAKNVLPEDLVTEADFEELEEDEELEISDTEYIPNL